MTELHLDSASTRFDERKHSNQEFAVSTYMARPPKISILGKGPEDTMRTI